MFQLYLCCKTLSTDVERLAHQLIGT